jgi:prepilin-type N-terminal cleavage/methylation domain-containing protein
MNKKINQRGYSIIEVMLAIAIFAMFAGVFVSAFVQGQQSTALAGKKTRATILAEEGLEAVRSIRNNGFNGLAEGQYGLEISNGQWSLEPSPENINGFTRVITIENLTEDHKLITSDISWQEESDRKSSLSLATVLGNWQGDTGPALTCSAYCQTQSYDYGICRKNSRECNINGENNETDGDQYCAQPPNNSCCCGIDSGDEISSCSDYCRDLGYDAGSCRPNSRQCDRYGETYESGGDQYCRKSCCCSD